MGKIPTNINFEDLDDLYGGMEPIKKTQNTNGVYKKDPNDQNVYESQRESTRGRKGDTYIGRRKKARN
jgi:hypothetical protein